MSILELLGLAGPKKTDTPTIDNKVLDEIAQELSTLPRDEALRVAAFAYVLSRVAYSDMKLGEEEHTRMRRLLQTHAALSPSVSDTVTKMATQKAKLFGSTHNYLVTREFNKIASHKEKKELLRAVFAVAAADGVITGAESRELRQVASELRLDRSDYTDLRVAFRDKLEENQ